MIKRILKRIFGVVIILGIMSCAAACNEAPAEINRKEPEQTEKTTTSEVWTEEVTAPKANAVGSVEQIEIIKMPVRFINNGNETIFQLFSDSYQSGEWGSNILPDDTVISPGGYFDGYVYIETGFTSVDFMIRTNNGTEIYEGIELGNSDVQQGAQVTFFNKEVQQTD